MNELLLARAPEVHRDGLDAGLSILRPDRDRLPRAMRYERKRRRERRRSGYHLKAVPFGPA